jgi:predicted dehydrogenase/nucleoside-diphosphate-sugar epimerase
MGNEAPRPSRIAIIGCGAVTEKKHLPALAASERTRVTALMDLDEARVNRLADQFEVPVRARTVADLASHADIALVAVPHHLHARVAVEAIRAGMHAFVEKPLATTMSDVHLMTAAAHEHGKRIGVGLVRRQYASFKLVASALASGMLGTIQSFDFREGGVYNWPVATDTTFRKATAGGVLFDTGAHTLDMLLAWLGAFEAVDYYDDSRGGVDANCLLELTLASGVRGTLELSRTRNLRNTCIIRGDRGELEVGVGPRGPVTIRSGGFEVGGAPQVVGQEEPSPLEQTRIQMEEFAAAVAAGTDCPLFAEHTLESIRLYDACKGQVKPLDLPWEDFAPTFDFSTLAGKTILVCGGTGFIGGRLVEVLAARSQAHVRVLSRTFSRLSGLSRFELDVVSGDVSDRASLARAMAGCDVVINCTYGAREAAQPINVDAVTILVEEAARAGVGRVIHLSTLSAYGLPPDGELTEDSPHKAPKSHLYGYTKLRGEQVGFAKAKELGLDFRVVQPTVVYGPGAPSWTQNPLRMLKAGRVILVNGGDGLCNGVYVDDLVLGILCTAASTQGQGERFLISGPEPATWRQFYGAYERMLGRESTVSLPLDEVLRLGREQQKKSGTKAQVVSLLRDPVVFRRLATLPFVSKAKNMASRPMIDAAKSLLLGARPARRIESAPRKRERPLQLLAESDAIFQAGKVHVSIAKAQRMLGYQPIYDLPRGMERTAAWVAWANLLD